MKEFLAWLGIFFGGFFSCCDSALLESFGTLRWPTWPRRRSRFVFLVWSKLQLLLKEGLAMCWNGIGTKITEESGPKMVLLLLAKVTIVMVV